MKDMRQLGSMIQKHMRLRNVSEQELAECLDIHVKYVRQICCGCVCLSFSQIDNLEKILGVTLGELFDTDLEYYRSNVIHCSIPFSDYENMEEILDIIEMYAYLVDAVHELESEVRV